MWSKLPKSLVASMLSSHLAVGLFAGALLYILCVSGTAMVFHQEFERWEQPTIPELTRAAPRAVQRAAEQALARGEADPHEINVALPTAGMPRLSAYSGEQGWWADGDGTLIAATDNEWAHFLEKLHYYLTMPWVLGLTVVGILGVLMTGLCLSGTLAHPRLFRDAFRFRRNRGARLGQADLHNRLSVWGLPFHLTIAITGAGIGLSVLVAAVFSPVVNDGRSDTFFDPLFGAEVEGPKQSAPVADLASAIAAFEQQHPELTPWWLSLHHPATEGQDGNILAQHPRRLIFGDYYRFDADGRLTDNVGLSDGDLGQQVVASLYPLHFGSYGGLPVKILYGLLGIASCIVVASGLNIWLIKRRQKGRAAPRIERAWAACVWGTPLVLVIVMLVDLVLAPGMTALIALFWLSLASACAAASAISSPRPDTVRRWLQLATAAVLLTTTLTHSMMFGLGTGMTIGLNLTLAVLAITCMVLARRPALVANSIQPRNGIGDALQ